MISVPPLSKEEQHRLIAAYRNGDRKARDRLVFSMAGLVHKFALKYRGTGIELDDLIMAAQEGLLVAIEKFDLSQDVTVSTYAVFWMRSKIQDCENEFNDLAGIDRNKRAEAFKVEATGKLSGHKKQLVKSIDHAKQIIMGTRAARLDAPIYEDLTLHDTIHDTGSSSESMVIERDTDSKNKERVAVALSSLTEKERIVVQRRWLVDDPDDVSTLATIGKEFGVCRERIRQIEQVALGKLRKLLAARYVSVPATDTEDKLRPYQRQAVMSIRSFLNTEPSRRLLVVMPTGSGKTIVICELIQSFLNAGKKVLVCTHRREIIGHHYDTLVSSGISKDKLSVVMSDDERHNGSAPIQIASISTLSRRGTVDADAVFIDEAHRAVSKSYRKLSALYPHAHHVGFTATPYRYDGAPLRDAYDTLLDVVRPIELIADGWVVPPRVWTVPSELLPNLRGVRVQHGDYDAVELDKRVCNNKLVGSIFEHWNRYGRGLRTVVFAVSIKHSKMIVEDFVRNGVNAVHIDGSTPHDERFELLRPGGLLDCGTVDVVSNCSVLGEGWNLPSCKCIIMARPTKSLTLYLQQAGRASRPWNNTVGVVLDHGGNAIRFGHPNMERDWSLDGTETDSGSAPEKECPNCHEVVPTGIAVCDCGYEWDLSRDMEPTVTDGTLVPLSKPSTEEVIASIRERVQKIADKRGVGADWVERVIAASVES